MQGNLKKLALCIAETPPHMRGRLSVFLYDLLAVRNTPAYAGKTFCKDVEPDWLEKHPRICGEDFHINMFKLSARPLTSITASGDHM